MAGTTPATATAEPSGGVPNATFDPDSHEYTLRDARDFLEWYCNAIAAAVERATGLVPVLSRVVSELAWEPPTRVLCGEPIVADRCAPARNGPRDHVRLSFAVGLLAVPSLAPFTPDLAAAGLLRALPTQLLLVERQADGANTPSGMALQLVNTATGNVRVPGCTCPHRSRACASARATRRLFVGCGKVLYR